MKVLDLKALMAAQIAAGYRSNPGAYGREPANPHILAEWVMADVEALLLAVTVRATMDDCSEFTEDFRTGLQLMAERKAESTVD